jgi:hypothetical protein
MCGLFGSVGFAPDRKPIELRIAAPTEGGGKSLPPRRDQSRWFTADCRSLTFRKEVATDVRSDT